MLELKQNNESFLEYAIRILDEDNISELGMVDTYKMLFGTDVNISYDNAQRQLRGIKKFIEQIKLNSVDNVDNKQNFNIDISLNKDGTQTRNALLMLSEEEIKTEILLLKAHGYDPDEWEIVNSKNSMWHQNSNKYGLKTLYCSKITVKPRTTVSLDMIEKIFEKMNREKDNKIEKPMIYQKRDYYDKHECLIVNFFDVHFAKLAHSSESGENYDYKIARERMLNSILEYKERFTDRIFDMIIFAIGQDYFNSEPTGSTVNNTRQDNDSRYSVMFEKGVEAIIDVINILRSMGHKIYVPLVQGNHSSYVEYYAAQYLKAWYRNEDDVEIESTPLPRKYYKYGVNLFGFSHNCYEKNRIYNLMQVEAPQMWANTIERTFFTGHLHCEDVKEQGGIFVRQAPTLCSTDAWHKREGYVGAIKRTQCFIYDEQNGLVETHYVMVK